MDKRIDKKELIKIDKGSKKITVDENKLDVLLSDYTIMLGKITGVYETMNFLRDIKSEQEFKITYD